MLQYSRFFLNDSLWQTTHRAYGHNDAGATGSNVLVTGFSRTEFAATRLKSPALEFESLGLMKEREVIHTEVGVFAEMEYLPEGWGGGSEE